MNHLIVYGVQLGIDQAHLSNGAADASGLHKVPGGKGVGGEEHDAARQVGQSPLHRQGDCQAQHAEEGHQACHGHPQISQEDADGNEPQGHLQP